MSSKRRQSGLSLTSISLVMLVLVSLPVSVSQDSPQTRTTSSATIIYADPATQTGTVGTNITVAFNILNANDIFAWQIDLRWDPSVLKFIDIAQGNFLHRDNQVNRSEIPDDRVKMRLTTSKTDEYTGSFLVYVLDENKSSVLIGETLLGERPGMSDNGTLCSAVFCVLKSGNSIIQIGAKGPFDTMILDSTIHQAPVTVIDGMFSTWIEPQRPSRH